MDEQSIMGERYGTACTLHLAADEELKAAEIKVEEAYYAAKPSMRLRPSLSIDGDQWCALYGANLMEGVCGFGDSPEKAYEDFDAEWRKKIKPYVKNGKVMRAT